MPCLNFAWMWFPPKVRKKKNRSFVKIIKTFIYK